MGSKITIAIIILLGIPFFGMSQIDVFGTWKAIDDADGAATSHINIFEKNGKLYGKIIKLLEEGTSEASLCDQCQGDKKNKPILGMEIIWDMKKNGDSWKGGRILDPENGKDYKCRIKLVDGVLEVRGYIGIVALGRTQKWYSVAP